MMQEEKRLAAAFVGGVVGKGDAESATSVKNGGGLSSTQLAVGATFEVWSRDSHGFCTECEDTRATVLCHDCDEPYCSLCWAALHRRGERAKHTTNLFGSEEDLATPPEALQASGWLAGVWPSQRPRVAPDSAISAPSSPSPAGAGPGVVNVLKNGDVVLGGRPPVVALPAGRGGNGVIVGNGGLAGNGKGVRGWEEPAVDIAAGSPARNGVAAVAARAAVVGAEAAAKKARLDCSATPVTPAPTATVVPPTPPAKPTGVELEVGTATPRSAQSSGSSGDGDGRRPTGYEGPFCPSGSFFSKPQTPPATPARGSPNGINGTSWKGKGKGKHQEDGARIDENGEADVAGGGRGRGVRSQESASPAAGGGGGSSGNGNGAAADGNGYDSNGNAGPRAKEGVENGHGENGSRLGSSAAAMAAAGEAAAGATVPALATAAAEAGGSRGSNDMDVEAPLFSAATVAAPAAPAGGTDVELPLISAPALDNRTGGGSSGGGLASGDGAVGHARVATQAEAKSLADLRRRSTNIPLRLDPREREILGVLEGSLHHMQYTDAVDRILRGNRLPWVLKNLKKFFTSVWGMCKASGVAPPTCTPPSGGPKGFLPRSPLPNRPPYQNWGRGGPPPSPFAQARAGGVGGNGTNVGGDSAGANGGGGKAGAVAGGAWYREDSFAFEPTSWEYTRDWALTLRTCFEVGRRHKILNPEKMRSAHGMLMCILMDAEHPLVREETGFSCVRTMRTAFGFLASTNLLGLFEDPDLLTASRPVLPWERDQKLQKGGRNEQEIALQAKEKEEARRRLVARHGTGGLEVEVKLLVDSVADSIVYREISTRPIRRMLSLLKKNWRPDRAEDPRKNANLGIKSGEFGARLTHNHKTQFYFVMQSLMLWLEVVDNMLDLWAAGEKDMLDESNQYRLSNTGQGLQRVQGATRVGKRMHEYQTRVNHNTGHPWVGSPVVHLGDNCVPNALTFLDKYSQVPWILNPILQALDYLTDLENGSDPVVLAYVKNRWGTVEYAQRYILRNFFRFGFDGSGGDNNYDAGSCVDGRLTSAWNWCSKIEKKSFIYVFMLSGFSGFDGDFSR